MAASISDIKRFTRRAFEGIGYDLMDCDPEDALPPVIREIGLMRDAPDDLREMARLYNDGPGDQLVDGNYFHNIVLATLREYI
jgi:hypothetical protein